MPNNLLVRLRDKITTTIVGFTKYMVLLVGVEILKPILDRLRMSEMKYVLESSSIVKDFWYD